MFDFVDKTYFKNDGFNETKKTLNIRNVQKKRKLLVSKILLLAVCYSIVGRLALLLAIPPGYATAIFPSAGIAVAALLIWGNRISFGVFLGSLLLNSWIAIEQGSMTMSGLTVAIGVASGAFLQALLAAWLVRRFVGYPTSLSNERDIFWFMFIVGPIASIVNASFGATSLWMNDLISANDYLFSWFTWWVGDAIGALITIPLLFIMFAAPRLVWKRRRYLVSIPLLLMLTISVFLFLLASRWEFERNQFAFKAASTDVFEKIQSSFNGYIDAVASIERFMSSTRSVSAGEFRTFVDYTLSNKKGINALSWNPLVLADERDNFELIARQQGLYDFQITERDKQGKVIRASERDLYVAVKYIEPIVNNKKAVGFDVASNSERREALIQARNSGKAVATEKIKLVQSNGTQAGFLLFYPVFESNLIAETTGVNELKGFAVGVFRVGDIVEEVLGEKYQHSLIVGIYDENAKAENVSLYGPEAFANNNEAPFKLSYTLNIGQRKWTIYTWPSANYLAKNRSFQAWGALVAALLFTSLLGAFLLSMTGRSYQTEKLVARRTAELSGILSTAIEAIITVDETGMIETINPAAELLFDYSAAELSGQPVNKVIPDFFNSASENSPDSCSNKVINDRRDSFAVKKDNSRVSIEIAISTLSLGDKTLYTSIIHDLTEREKINQMKDEFISTVSHELRTPLTSIKGTLGLVVAGVLDNEPQKSKELLKISLQNSERLELLINDLLDINKTQSSINDFKVEVLCISTLISNAIEFNEGYASKYQVTIQWKKSDSDSLFINASESKLIQVLSNFLSNAIKYSATSGVVSVFSDCIGDKIRISVQDTGSGIPIEFHEKVFDKFTQGDSSDTRRVGGTGLGMAISKAIIEKHGGVIGFDSQPGEGSTFYFKLAIHKN